VLDLADLDRSVVIGVDDKSAAVKQEDNSDCSDVLEICSELIHSAANKIKGSRLFTCCYVLCFF